MSPVTYDRLRWWIVGTALFAALVCAVSVAHDVDATALDAASVTASE